MVTRRAGKTARESSAPWAPSRPSRGDEHLLQGGGVPQPLSHRHHLELREGQLHELLEGTQRERVDRAAADVAEHAGERLDERRDRGGASVGAAARRLGVAEGGGLVDGGGELAERPQLCVHLRLAVEATHRPGELADGREQRAQLGRVQLRRRPLREPPHLAAQEAVDRARALDDGGVGVGRQLGGVAHLGGRAAEEDAEHLGGEQPKVAVVVRREREQVTPQRHCRELGAVRRPAVRAGRRREEPTLAQPRHLDRGARCAGRRRPLLDAREEVDAVAQQLERRLRCVEPLDLTHVDRQAAEQLGPHHVNLGQAEVVGVGEQPVERRQRAGDDAELLLHVRRVLAVGAAHLLAQVGGGAVEEPLLGVYPLVRDVDGEEERELAEQLVAQPTHRRRRAARARRRAAHVVPAQVDDVAPLAAGLALREELVLQRAPRDVRLELDDLQHRVQAQLLLLRLAELEDAEARRDDRHGVRRDLRRHILARLGVLVDEHLEEAQRRLAQLLLLRRPHLRRLAVERRDDRLRQPVQPEQLRRDAREVVVGRVLDAVLDAEQRVGRRRRRLAARRLGEVVEPDGDVGVHL